MNHRVVIVANAFCSRNRRHDQSILNADASEPGLAVLDFDRSGWDGRNSIELDGDGRIPLQTPGADIEGLTSTDRLLSVAADWVSPGAGSAVFPAASSAALEPGVDPGRLLPV